MVGAAALALLLPLALRRAKRRPLHALVRTVRCGLLVATTGAALGLATDRVALHVVYACLGLGYVFFPASRGLASALVGADDQGKALGLIANVESLGAIVSPVVWGYVYRATVGWSAGLAFFAMGGTAAVALALSIGLRSPSQLLAQ